MKKILAFLVIVISLISCRDEKQDSNTLPEATQVGKNTGGALVNGQVWVAKIENPNFNPGGNQTLYNIDLVLNKYSLQIVLRQYNNDDNLITFNITDNQDFTPQTYILNGNNYATYRNPSVLYITNSANTGTLTITKFDKVNQVVSGTFSFKAVNSAGEVVNITEGRFDRKYSL